MMDRGDAWLHGYAAALAALVRLHDEPGTAKSRGGSDASPRLRYTCPMITAAIVLKMSLLVTDTQGHHPTKGIPNEGAEAIAGSCSTTGASAVCAAVLVVQAFRESGYRLAAVGDGGLAHGPFQTHTSHAPKTWKEAVAQFVPILQRSAQACKEPLAMVASGSCTNKAGIAISKARMAEARRIAAEVMKEES